MADGDLVNKNICNTQKITLATGSYTALAAERCSEVIVVSTDWFLVKTSTDTGTVEEMLVPANTYFTVRGITNASQVTAQGNSTSVLYARTQYFGGSTLAFG